MAPPVPVLDKYKRIIPILDPYAEKAMNMAYGEQYGKIFFKIIFKNLTFIFCPKKWQNHLWQKKYIKWLFQPLI